MPRFFMFCILLRKGYNTGYMQECIYICANKNFALWMFGVFIK